jgi:glutamine amidotransferase
MITIIDYEAGNLRSVQRACQRVGLDSTITADPEDVISAERIIFPGVGSAASAVDTLRERGLDDALKEAFRAGIPIFGICLGTQIILEYTEEDQRDCLGLVKGECKRFQPEDRTLKVPHMGWNGVRLLGPHPLLESVKSGNEFYFVHSYYACPSDPENILGVTEYGHDFCSIIGKDNLFATQFHIEKSGEFGLSILKKFGSWNGTNQ